MTEALADKKQKRSADGAEPEPVTPAVTPTATAGAVPVPGLAHAPAGLKFVRSWSEVVAKPPAATAMAVRQHARCKAEIVPLRRALANRHVPAQTLAELHRRLDEIAARLLKVEQTEVELQDRQHVIDLMAGTFAEMTAIWKDALTAEKALKLQEAADEQERLRQEEEKNKLPAAYTGKAASYGKAKSLATTAAEETFTQTSSAITTQKQESLDALNPSSGWEKERKKKKGPGRGHQPKNQVTTSAPQISEQELKQQKIAAIELSASSAIQQAESDRDSTIETIIAKLGSVASSPSGLQVEDSTLVEIFDLGHGSIHVCQALTDVAATSGGLSLTRAVAAEKNPIPVAQECLKLIHLTVDPFTVLAPAKLLARSGSGPFANWLCSLIGGPDFFTATAFAGHHVLSLGLVAKVVPVIGVEQVAHDLIGWLEPRKEKGADIDWLLSCRAQLDEKVFTGFVTTIINGNVSLADFHGVFTKAGANFTVVELVPLCQSFRAKLPQLVNAIAEADPHQVRFVQLAASAGKLSSTLKTALRAESMLFHNTPAFVLKARSPRAPSVINDIPYGRHYTNPRLAANEAGDNRTGFLRLGFPTAPTVGYIHTHWMANNQSGIITSMHVKSDDTVDGVKGTELNDFPSLFTLLPKKIAEVQSAAPHTGPDLKWVPK